MKLYPYLINRLTHTERVRCAVACAEDETVLVLLYKRMI